MNIFFDYNGKRYNGTLLGSNDFAKELGYQKHLVYAKELPRPIYIDDCFVGKTERELDKKIKAEREKRLENGLYTPIENIKRELANQF
jgi:hypothetical protein